jgi:periplasmic mercuric ion binding protein
MKSFKIIASILFSLFISNTSFAQKDTVKKETVKVWGNCGMCKTKIEKAAKAAGATKANWNEDSKMLQVTYSTNKSSNTKIQEAIAKTGYDTQDFTADNTAYAKLHGCCQYDRKEAAAKQ